MDAALSRIPVALLYSDPRLHAALGKFKYLMAAEGQDHNAELQADAVVIGGGLAGQAAAIHLSSPTSRFLKLLGSLSTGRPPSYLPNSA
jgi:hypothetical protein